MPKPGFITASLFNKVMTKSPDTKTVQKECYRIACERLGVTDLDDQSGSFSGSQAMEWGNENEHRAIAAYEAEHFALVHSAQEFVQIPGRLIGGHPDGLVCTDGMIEVKCPNSDNHLLNLTHGEQIPTYLNQIQASMWIYGREWCDFISYDPRFPEDLRLYVKRIERDQSLIDAIDQRAQDMEKIIADLIEKIKPGFVFTPAA